MKTFTFRVSTSKEVTTFDVTANLLDDAKKIVAILATDDGFPTDADIDLIKTVDFV